MKKIVKARDLIRFKVALIGDAMVGKTCLVENYTGVTTIGRCCDLAINFSELNIPLRSKIIKLIFNDLCGTVTNMFRHTVKDASVVILAFDLTNALSLRKLEAFYDQLNKIGQKNLFLVGCKYDEFLKKDKGYVQKMTDLAIRVSRLFNCPVVFCSSKRSVNINKLFKAIICQFYKVDCGFEEMRTPGQPVFIYNEFLKPEKDQEHGPFRKESGFEQTPAIGASG